MNTPGANSGLFQSLTVLSLEQATTLPFMTLKLAQEGARVIRLEAPPYGDPNRWVGQEVLPDPTAEDGFEKGMNAYYLPNNLGKRSITLNLATAEGRSLLHRLVRELPVDIFATNQRPRTYRKLGIDPETLRAIRPELIWVGITGFGPESDEAAYDPILQARAGFMDLTGERDGEPMIFGLPMVDLGAGEHAYGQVMRALYLRAVEGCGARIDVSMYQSAVSWMVSPVMFFHSFDQLVRRHGNTHQFFAPAATFSTRDGYVYLAVGNDRQWEALTEIPEFSALGRAEYTSNAGRIASLERLYSELTGLTRDLTSDQVIAILTAIGVPVSRVNTLRDVCADPLIGTQLVRACDAVTDVAIAIPPPPVIPDYLRRRGMTLDFPPRLGEYNAELFGGLGYEVAELRAKGVL